MDEIQAMRENPTTDAVGDDEISTQGEDELAVEEGDEEHGEEENLGPEVELSIGGEKYIPQGRNDHQPFVGKTFNSMDEAFEFYNSYARVAGFSTRKHTSKKIEGTTTYMSKTFTCSRQGLTNLRYQEKEKHTKQRSGERKRGRSRCLCMASITVKKLKTGDTWIVSKFIAEHTHPLTSPGKVQFLPSHRKVTPAQKSLLDQLSLANIPTFQQYRVLGTECTDLSSVGCQERDIRNVERDKRQKKLGHDAETLVSFFECEKEVDDNYYYSIESEEGVFNRCFWADSTSRSAYAYFGDVVVFDTTYNTNTYGMILAPFVGVNHHRQTILLGCGLLSDERTESFVWLFSQFLEAMPTRVAPKVIITDQDQAIGRAIAKVFPPTVHRLCLWHITNKFSEKLGPSVYNDYRDILSAVVYRSETPEEFEKKWGDLMSTTILGGNQWLRNMYAIRERWVPAYVKHLFAAGMTSSQRVESHHSFLKSYVIRKNSLSDFIVRVKDALRHQRHMEIQADHIDKSEVPVTLTNNHIEAQMRNEYTKAIFLLFQEELVQSSSYDYLKISSTVDAKVYQLSRFDASSDHPRHVTWYTGPDMIITCSCKLYEFSGYLCRHILCILYRKGVRTIPDHYILNRWTKKAKLVPTFDPIPAPSVRESSIATRTKMITDFVELANEVFMLPEVRSLVMQGISELRRQSREIMATMGSVNPNTENVQQGGTNVEGGLSIQDPVPLRAKGCGKRLKSSKEKAMSQSKRKCGVCRQTGHNAKNCLKNNSRTSLMDVDYRPHASFPPGGVGESMAADTVASQGADNYSIYMTTVPGDPFLE